MRNGRAVRVSTGAIAAAGAATAVLTWAGPGGDTRPDTLERWIVCAAALLAWACVVWLALGALLVVGAQAQGVLGRLSARVALALTPRAFRRAVEVALGATLVTAPITTPALAAPALADTASAPVSSVVTGDTRSALPSLDRPTASPAQTAAARPSPGPGSRPRADVAPGNVGLVSPAPRPQTGVAAEVVVRPGDTLWSIAARHLGPQPSLAEIAHEWPRWHAVNRVVIGDDPDVLHPGERLRPPRDTR